LLTRITAFLAMILHVKNLTSNLLSSIAICYTIPIRFFHFASWMIEKVSNSVIKITRTFNSSFSQYA
jgi:hypothetical protein